MEIMQKESRKRLESESDSRKNQDRFVEELHAREKELLQQLSLLKNDKQRLEDTIYRLKTESMTSSVSLKQLQENFDREKNTNVSELLRCLCVFCMFICLLFVCLF